MWVRRRRQPRIQFCEVRPHDTPAKNGAFGVQTDLSAINIKIALTTACQGHTPFLVGQVLEKSKRASRSVRLMEPPPATRFQVGLGELVSAASFGSSNNEGAGGGAFFRR